MIPNKATWPTHRSRRTIDTVNTNTPKKQHPTHTNHPLNTDKRQNQHNTKTHNLTKRTPERERERRGEGRVDKYRSGKCDCY